MKPIILCLFLVMSAPFAVAADGDLYTNVYVVPPTFLNTGQAPLVDPFRNLRPAPARRTAKDILMHAGIIFGEGTSAIYNPSTSQLIVRNTQDQMELVEAYIESITQGVEKQIYVTVNEAQIDEGALKDGWMDKVKFGGGKVKLPDAVSSVLELPPLPKPVEKKRTRIFDSPDMFRKEFSRPPSIPSNEGEKVGRKINGSLTDPEFQILVRALNQQKGVDLHNLPSVMVRSGQLAMSQQDDKRYGVQATLGADEFSVDLSLFLPLHGEPLFDELDAVTTPHQVTVWDGQTVVIAERREKGKSRFVFVKAQIMDPAGMPIHGKVEKKKDASGSKKPPVIAADSHASPEIQFTTAMQESVKMADEAALRGSQLMADRNFTGGIEKYEEALSLLPEHEMTVPRREAYEKQFSRARMLLAGDSYEKKNLEEHRVEKGETLFRIATDNQLSVGDIKEANNLKGEMLEVGQILILPRKNEDFQDALKTIIIPKVNFSDESLDDALGQLLVLIHKHADRGLFPNFKPRISLSDAEVIGNPKITLRLSNVPVSEALRYVTSLSQCKYRIEGEVIVVEPLNK